MSDCGNCANYNTERMCHTDICSECFVEGQNGHISGKPSKWKPLPITNGDRIRAMTDEDLADFLCNNAKCGSCRFENWGGCTLRDWLKQPVGANHV